MCVCVCVCDDDDDDGRTNAYIDTSAIPHRCHSPPWLTLLNTSDNTRAHTQIPRQTHTQEVEVLGKPPLEHERHPHAYLTQTVSLHCSRKCEVLQSQKKRCTDFCVAVQITHDINRESEKGSNILRINGANFFSC